MKSAKNFIVLYVACTAITSEFTLPIAGAELLCMASVANSAYELEKASKNKVSPKPGPLWPVWCMKPDSIHVHAVPPTQHYTYYVLGIMSRPGPSALPLTKICEPRRSDRLTGASPPPAQADEVELLELQSVLLEHVLALKISLEAQNIRTNPAPALDAVNGHFDQLRRAPSIPIIDSSNLDLSEARATERPQRVHQPHPPAHLTRQDKTLPSSLCLPLRQHTTPRATLLFPPLPSAPQELAHTLPTASSGGGFRTVPCPPRIAVVSRDQTTRRIIATALTSSIEVEVVTYDRLEHVASDEAPVVVICTCPEMPFRRSTILPRVSPTGVMRGFVIVGDVDMLTQEAIYTRMWGWCDHVRMPLVAPELIRRIQSVFASTQSAACSASWSGPRKVT